MDGRKKNNNIVAEEETFLDSEKEECVDKKEEKCENIVAEEANLDKKNISEPENAYRMLCKGDRAEVFIKINNTYQSKIMYKDSAMELTEKEVRSIYDNEKNAKIVVNKVVEITKLK